MKCKQLTGKLFTTVYHKECVCAVRVSARVFTVEEREREGGCVCGGVGGSSSSTGEVLCCNVSVIIIKQHRGLWVGALTGGEHV